MSMLPRLKPRCFYDLVIEVAIVRPGPIQGGMIHPYLRRRSGQEQVTYPDERIRDVLAKTLGVPLFQEQVMRLAVVAAGFTPGEADQLRRAMAAWKRSGDLSPFQMRLMKGMLANGYSREFAEVVFKQISGFAEYGFPESHAASFALLVYASAWIKLYHPAAFLAALINAQPLGFYTPAQLVADAIRHGVEVRAVDVNESTYDCRLEGANRARSGSEGHIGESDEATKRRSDEGKDEERDEGKDEESCSEPQSEPEAEARGILNRDGGTEGRRDEGNNKDRRSGTPGAMPKRSAGMPQPADITRYGRAGPAVRLGMRVVRGISAEKVRGIEAARREGPITSIGQLARRPDVSRQTLVRLAAADAFRSLGLDRREALWRISGARSRPARLTVRRPGVRRAPAASADDVAARNRRAGLRRHRLVAQRPPDRPAARRADPPARQPQRNPCVTHAPGQRISVAGLVTVRQRPMTAKGMVFMTLEDENRPRQLDIAPASLGPRRPKNPPKK